MECIRLPCACSELHLNAAIKPEPKGSQDTKGLEAASKCERRAKHEKTIQHTFDVDTFNCLSRLISDVPIRSLLHPRQLNVHGSPALPMPANTRASC